MRYEIKSTDNICLDNWDGWIRVSIYNLELVSPSRVCYLWECNQHIVALVVHKDSNLILTIA